MIPTTKPPILLQKCAQHITITYSKVAFQNHFPGSTPDPQGHAGRGHPTWVWWGLLLEIT